MALEIALELFILSAAVLFLVTEWMPMEIVAFLVLGSQPSISVPLKKAVFKLLWLNPKGRWYLADVRQVVDWMKKKEVMAVSILQ